MGARELDGFVLNSYSHTLTHSAHDVLDIAAAGGAAGVELMVYPDHLWPDSLAAGDRAGLRRRASDAGLPVVSLNMPNIDVNVASPNEGMRRHSLDLLTGTIRLAGDLGARGVVIGPGKANPLLPAPEARLKGWFFAALDILMPEAERSGVELWLENMPFAFLPGVPAMLAALEEGGHGGLGIVYDLANAYFIGEDFTGGLELIGSRLRLIHVSDTGRDAYRHAPVGTGDIDFTAAAAAVERRGWTAPVVLEIITPDPGRDIPDSARRLRAGGWRPGGWRPGGR